MRKVKEVLMIGCVLLTASLLAFSNVEEPETQPATHDLVDMVPVQSYSPEPLLLSSDTVVNKNRFTEEEIQLMALITFAEAEGESEYGKRLVIDTILNRVDSPYFPDTVEEVIYQPYHFESVWNGRIDRSHVTENICTLVREEIQSITNDQVIYFCAGAYSQYGIPLLQEENHYFSTY